MKAIGLDIGTTKICGVLFDCDSAAVEKASSRPNDTWVAGKHTWEKLQDPSAIYGKVLDILNEIYEPAAQAIGVTGQMHGILYLDPEGRPLGPLYTWQDGRGEQPYRGGTYASFLKSFTGYGNVTHFYNQINGIVPPGAAVYCTVHDYAAMRLAGQTRPLVHCSDGASFGLYDIDEHRFTVPDPMHPPVTRDASLLGTWRGIPVSVAIGDNQASYIGSGCGPDTVLVNVGTGSQITFMETKGVHASDLERRPLSGDGVLLVGSSLCGGRAYALLERFFRQVAALAGAECESLYSPMERIGAEVSPCDVLFDTRFCGTRSEPGRRAGIYGLSEDNFTPGHVVHACLNGIAEELWQFYLKAGAACGRLVGSGNGIRRNRLLCRALEDRFNMKMAVPVFCEEAAVGAALFAATATGGFAALEDTRKVIRYMDNI